MGRKQHETDLRTLQKHIHEHEIKLERVHWIQKAFARKKEARKAHRRVYDHWAYRPMTVEAFQVIVNDVAREYGMKQVRYRGR